jgi:DNA-binding NarL/FixJ family response regulator
MPILDGQTAAEKILKLFPEIKILMLSMYSALSFCNNLQSIGVKGYLPKDTDAELLFSVIREISSGNSYFRQQENCIPALNRFAETDAFLKKHNLTHRELEILKLISENLSSKQIASKLFISLYTVDTHRKNMIQKLKLSGKTDLIKFAFQNNPEQKPF